MNISERLREVVGDHPPTAHPIPAAPSPIAEEVDHSGHNKPISTIKMRVVQTLFDRLGTRLYDLEMSKFDLRQLVVEGLSELVSEEDLPLSEHERRRLVDDITNDVLGYGPIEQYLIDKSVTEIMVNSDKAIYIERNGRVQLTLSKFHNVDHLRQVIDRIVSSVGRRIDESSPMVDARLADGSRVNAIIPPLAVDGPALTIRKFSKEAYGFEDLIGFGTLTRSTSHFLSLCVKARRNILIAGGTGTGKTTLLNVVSSFIPIAERLVTIEDAVELQLQQPHVIRLEARPPNIEGRGEIAIRDLVRNALRMRPDRIVVGEVRGPEALDMLQAMNTGHEGSLSTLHANSPRDAIARIETMILMAGMDLPLRAIREQIASAIDVIVHIQRMKDGSRRVVEISEVVGMEGDVVTLGSIFAQSPVVGADGVSARGGPRRRASVRCSWTPSRSWTRTCRQSCSRSRTLRR